MMKAMLFLSAALATSPTGAAQSVTGLLGEWTFDAAEGDVAKATSGQGSTGSTTSMHRRARSPITLQGSLPERGFTIYHVQPEE